MARQTARTDQMKRIVEVRQILSTPDHTYMYIRITGIISAT